MKQHIKVLLIFGIIGLIYIIINMNWQSTLTSFLRKWEGFRAYPYWDFKQWSHGYGTRVKGSSDNKAIPPPNIPINRQDAAKEMINFVTNDYNTLNPLINKQLTPNQWAALLSFSYNLGAGNAKKIIPYINNNDDFALKSKWVQYNNAGGKPNEYLTDRRQAEVKLYFS